MPTWDSLAAFSRELAGLEGDLTHDEVRRVTRLMAVDGEKIAARHAVSDLGADRAFSGWNRGNPIPLGTHLKAGSNGTTLILPKFPGGWTVAEFGRNASGGAGGFQGPGVNLRTGLTSRTKSGSVRKARARKARRYNGVTQPKHTARAAVNEMERKLPPIADKAVLKVIRKRFDVT